MTIIIITIIIMAILMSPPRDVRQLITTRTTVPIKWTRSAKTNYVMIVSSIFFQPVDQLTGRCRWFADRLNGSRCCQRWIILKWAVKSKKQTGPSSLASLQIVPKQLSVQKGWFVWQKPFNYNKDDLSGKKIYSPFPCRDTPPQRSQDAFKE